MCNPRKITVRASRDLSRAWSAEIARRAEVSETLTGEARISEPFGTSLAPPVRERFEALIRYDSRWQQTGEQLRYRTHNGHLVYHLDSGELEIVAVAQGELRVEGSATRRREGTTATTSQADATVSYYGDGHAGKNRQWAQREGDALAGAEAETQAREQLDRQWQDERARAAADLEAESHEVEAEAYAQAQRRLAEGRDAVRVELETEASAAARNLHTEFLDVVGEPLSRAYRDVLLARAAADDISNLYHSEEDGVIEIQFEMEA